MAQPSSSHHASTSKANAAITYGKSWADDIQKYHAAKATLPWQPEQQTPVKHVTRFEKSRQECEYDLVLGKFRDAEREVQLKRSEKDALEHNLESARAKQLRNMQRFNVVNHSLMYPNASDPKDKPPQPHPYRKKIAAEFNIVSNISYSNNQSSTLEAAAHHTPSKRPTRDFNILTNKYHEAHDLKAEREAAKKKEVAAVKYCKTRIFDPVRITFVDEQREQQFVQDRAEEQQIHGQNRVLLLPPREQFAEGRLYNILNQRVINEEKLTTMSEKDARALNKIQKTAFEAKMRVQGDETLQRETQLCLNRFAHERNAQSYVHGFDPISNEAFEGRHAKKTMPTRTHAALSAWQVLESGVPMSTKIQKPATASIASGSTEKRADLLRESSRDQYQRQHLSSSGLDSHQKPNILIVDHVLPAAAATPVQRTSAMIRTGGFAH